jgi:hypothetical protein
MWTYKGIDVFRADINSSGIRWYARTPWGILRADTKQSMRELISATMADNGVTRFSYRSGRMRFRFDVR